MDDIPLMGSTTRIDTALRMVQDEMYEEENGARKDVPRILILLTDGSQTQAPDAEDPGKLPYSLKFRLPFIFASRKLEEANFEPLKLSGSEISRERICEFCIEMSRD